MMFFGVLLGIFCTPVSWVLLAVLVLAGLSERHEGAAK